MEFSVYYRDQVAFPGNESPTPLDLLQMEKVAMGRVPKGMSDFSLLKHIFRLLNHDPRPGDGMLRAANIRSMCPGDVVNIAGTLYLCAADEWIGLSPHPIGAAEKRLGRKLKDIDNIIRSNLDETQSLRAICEVVYAR